MSSRMQAYTEAINQAITDEDDNRLLDLLEEADAMNLLPGKGPLLLGIVLMMPPFVDEPASLQAFARLFEGPLSREAAIWYGYVHVVLYPVDHSFVDVLKRFPDSAFAWYILGRYHAMYKDMPRAILAMEKSLSIRAFPRNLRFLSKQHPALSRKERRAYRARAKQMEGPEWKEGDPWPQTMDKLYELYWDDLITGMN